MLTSSDVVVMPAGLEPGITSLRGLRPVRLDEGTILEIRVGFEPTINSFAGCPLQPLEYRIMAGIVGFKPTVAGIKGRCLSRLAISQYYGDPRRTRTGHCSRERAVS